MCKPNEALLGYALLEPGIPCKDLIRAVCGSTRKGREHGKRWGEVMGVMEGSVKVFTCSDGRAEEYGHGRPCGGHDAIMISRDEIFSVAKDKARCEGDDVSFAFEESDVKLCLSWEKESVTDV